MNVKQFRYSSDNLSYLIYGKSDAMVIDGGAVDSILSFADSNGLKIRFVANTHSHPDHTSGTQAVLDRSGAEYLDNKSLRKNKVIEIEGEKIQVYHTPGHTRDSLCFYVKGTLITGDTLFNGTVGNCFSGDLDGFLKSLSKLLRFPDETVIYAGHDYVEESMAFARKLEPDNREIKIFLKNYDPIHVRSTLLDERKVNPYLKFNDEKMISVLKKRGLPVKTENERWKSLMSIE